MKNNPFPSYYEEFIHKSRYARWIEKENRREDWDETVKRYLDFMINVVDEKSPGNSFTTEKWRNKLESAIFSLEIMPSMRAMMTAGKALQRDNVAGYNCSFLPIDDVKSFDEAMYILLCGTGVGFSVEKQYVHKLPDIPEKLYDSETTIVVSDSKEGWAKAYRQLIALLYSGEVPKWNTSKVRGPGARLKTFGGRASGPKPLEDLFRFTIARFRAACGRKLTSLECHDILCKIGEVVVVGGVRRSAMISLSDLDDILLANAKSIFKVDQYSLISEDDASWTYALTMKKDQATRPTYTVKLKKGKDEWDKEELENNKVIGWWQVEPQRALSNNSVSYKETPSVGEFMQEWLSMYESKSGERGMFNRIASQKQTQKFGRRESNFEFGTNPCCVSGDTVVDVKINDKKEKIRIKDLVELWASGNKIEIRSYNLEEGRESYDVISFAGLTRPNAKTMKITDTETGKSIVCTPDHKVFTENRGYVEARYLKEDDVLKIG